MTALTIDKKLLDIEFLIYSSHKTATQTILGSLNHNGIKSRHCHHVENIGLDESEFSRYLDMYRQKNHKNLNIISVFRDPLDRLISSFFQWHGSRPVRDREVASEADALVIAKPITELIDIFADQYCENPEVPIFESIDEICNQLSVQCNELVFSESSELGVNHLEKCNLYLFRFDLLVRNFSAQLSSISGKEIKLTNRNIGSSKFYADRYQQFRDVLQLPASTIDRVYRSRKCLIDVFYPGEYQNILDKTLRRYGIPKT